jgi:flagellar hook-length control protein FliK
MSQTNLDFLFQVTAPGGDRSGFNIPRSDPQTLDFGDHLTQASSSTPRRTTALRAADDRPPVREPFSEDRDLSPSVSPRSGSATATEPADDEVENANLNEPQRVEENAAAHAKESGVLAAEAEKPNDGDHEQDDESERGNGGFLPVAEAAHQVTSIVAANAELTAAVASEHEPINTDSPAAADEGGQTLARAAGTTIAEQQTTANALTFDAMAGTSSAIKMATPPGEPVDETALPTPNKKLLPAEPQFTAVPKWQTQHVETTSKHEREAETGGDVAAKIQIGQNENGTANVDPKSSDPGPTTSDPGTNDSRDADAHSQARQRSDAVALANTITTAAVSTGIPTQENSKGLRETSDGATRASKAGSEAAAKLDAVGDAANRLHAAGSSKRGSRVRGADETPRVDPARFVGRVAKAFHTAQERGGTLQIRLSPPELGAMRLELTVKDGVMTATMETETASARRVLLEHLPGLRDRLAEQNIRVERFDVDVRREGSGGHSDARAAQDQHQPQHGHSEQRRRQAPPPIADTARQTMPVIGGRTSDNGINLVA